MFSGIMIAMGIITAVLLHRSYRNIAIGACALGVAIVVDRGPSSIDAMNLSTVPVFLAYVALLGALTWADIQARMDASSAGDDEERVRRVVERALLQLQSAESMEYARYAGLLTEKIKEETARLLEEEARRARQTLQQIEQMPILGTAAARIMRPILQINNETRPSQTEIVLRRKAEMSAVYESHLLHSDCAGGSHRTDRPETAEYERNPRIDRRSPFQLFGVSMAEHLWVAVLLGAIAFIALRPLLLIP